jgi:type VI secretion system protein ImpF
MAELAPRERLQPSLLDRLTDDEPHAKQESRDKRVLSPARLRESVRRDLGWLLNTVNLATVQDLDAYPDVVRSVVNFGMADLTGRTASSFKHEEARDEVESHLLRVIRDFEPRLSRASVKVRMVVDEALMSHNAMRFDIEAELWAQPLPLRLFLRTEIDLESGTVSVAEASQAGG